MVTNFKKVSRLRRASIMAIENFYSDLSGPTVFYKVTPRLLDLPLVFFSFSPDALYGVRNEEGIYDLTTSAVSHLWHKGCDLVILACNTASASALSTIKENNIPTGVRVLGVFVKRKNV